MRALPPHPGRIIVDDARLTAIVDALKASDPVINLHCNTTFTSAVELLNTSPLPWPGIHGDGGILGAARDIELRIQTLALSARILAVFEELDGTDALPACIDRVIPHGVNSTSFATRGIAEMLNAGTFPTWNPGHQLDVAELTQGIGFGYDQLWLYMSDE